MSVHFKCGKFGWEMNMELLLLGINIIKSHEYMNYMIYFPAPKILPSCHDFKLILSLRPKIIFYFNKVINFSLLIIFLSNSFI